MRTSILCLAAALAVFLVLPRCSAKPGELLVKKSNAASASSSSSASSASSEQIIKKGGCGCGKPCGCGKGAAYISSKKKSAVSAASSASSSSSSFEARKVGGGCSLLTDVQIKETYVQKKGESFDVYCKRIFSDEYEWTKTTESYVKTLSSVWKNFNTLDFWYKPQYLQYSKKFFSLYYAKTESESWDVYYSRLIKKLDWESDTCYYNRLTVVRDCFPDLKCWSDEKFARSYYALEFKKFTTESDEQYIERVFAKDSYFDTTDIAWATRLFYIQEATYNSCNWWYSEKYFPKFEKFYSIWYARKESQACDLWLTKTLSLLPGENLDFALKRIAMIKKVTGSCGCWTTDFFKKVQTAKSLQESWLVKCQKAFFPCGCGGVAVHKSSSSSSSSSSASAASSSSESVKVVA